MTPKGENNTSPDKTETQSQERQIKNNGFKKFILNKVIIYCEIYFMYYRFLSKFRACQEF